MNETVDDIFVEEVAPLPKGVWKVTVTAQQATTQHQVSLDQEYYEHLTDSTVPAAELVRRSFVFLLEREPNTAILKEFTLQTIQKYFPEFEDTLKAGCV